MTCKIRKGQPRKQEGKRRFQLKGKYSQKPSSERSGSFRKEYSDESVEFSKET